MLATIIGCNVRDSGGAFPLLGATWLDAACRTFGALAVFRVLVMHCSSACSGIMLCQCAMSVCRIVAARDGKWEKLMRGRKTRKAVVRYTTG